jgi:hypothetical protein
MSLKFCKDCIHFLPLSEMCNSEYSVKGQDPIWGRHEKISAREMRGNPDWCGLSAKYHEDMNGFKKYISEGVIE